MSKLEKNSIPLLNHGYIRLVDHMGDDLSIVRAARASFDAAWRAGKDQGSDERLLRYLWRNRHTTPFEAVTFTFEVYAPIFVFRQWHRHRTWTYNELSARYRELPANFYVPDAYDIGTQSKVNKQGRDTTTDLSPEELRHRNSTVAIYEGSCKDAYAAYQYLLRHGWPRELARGVLPLSMFSQMFATVDLHNLFHFLTLRTHSHAQYEIRVYADAILELIAPIVPVAVSVWQETKDTDAELRAAMAQVANGLFDSDALENIAKRMQRP